MKTKIIPFNLELAKKIQAGEIKGEIKTNDNVIADVILWRKSSNRGGLRCTEHVGILKKEIDEVIIFNDEGNIMDSEHSIWSKALVLEVPDDEPQFKPFDKVLVRDKETDKWLPSFYATTDDLLYYTIDYTNWKQCIPYEGNEHLLGTTDEPKEK